MCTAGMMKATQGVVHLLSQTNRCRSAGLESLLLEPMTHCIQRVDELVAQPVLDLRQSMRIVVGVLHVTAVGSCRPIQLPDVIVVISRGFAGDGAGVQPSARPIGQRGDDAVGIGDRGRSTSGVVSCK